MAAPLSLRLNGKIFAYGYKQLNRSIKPGENTFKLLGLQAQYHSSKSGSLFLRIKPRLWHTAVLSGGITTTVLLSQLLTNSKGNIFKVFAESQQQRPYFKPSRQVRMDTDASGLKFTLYQFQTCPFCCKVRAVLDYYGFSYDVIEVNSVTKKQIKWTDYPKVPILVVEPSGTDKEVIIKDSSVIVSVLESYLHDRSTSLAKYVTFYPSITETVDGKNKIDFPNKYFIMFQENTNHGITQKQRNEEIKWRKWADDHLVHMLSPNVYRTAREALQAFHYFSDVGQWEKNFSFLERQMVIYVGATVMYILGKVLKSRHNLKDDVRQSLYDACNEWLKAVGKDRPFMGGDQPNLSDLAVYGVLNSIEGCPAFQDAVKNTKIGHWYNRTKLAVQNHQGSHPFNVKSLPSNKPQSTK